MYLRLFLIVTRGRNHVKLRGFLTIVPNAYLSEKIYKNIPRRVKYTLRGSFSVNHKSIKPQLFLFEGLYRPFFHHILR